MNKLRRLWIVVLCLLVVLPFSLRVASHAAEGVQKDIAYGEAGGQKLELDVYGADPALKRPAIVFLHGGGWAAGSRGDIAQAATAFAQKGYVGFGVSYRLVRDGKNRFPAQIDDVQRAVRWIRAHATDYGVDPDRIGALGFSAGGHLAALLGTTDTRDNSIPELSKYSSRVQCVVDIYGPTDFTAAVDDQFGEVKLRNDILQGFLGPWPENAANYRAASPVVHVDKKTVPFLIFHGGKDTLVPLSQSEILDSTLRKAGIESKLTVFPDAGHGYSDPASVLKTFADSLEFFDRHLKK